LSNYGHSCGSSASRIGDHNNNIKEVISYSVIIRLL